MSYNNRGGRGGGRGRGGGDSNDTEAEHFRKLFIGGLSYETTDEGLKGHFEKWGTIVDCVVMRDPNTKKSRGFGFITYENSSCVDDCQAARPHVIDRREVEPKRAVPREESGKPEAHMSLKKIFVGGIKDEMTEEAIREYFQGFGNIESVDVIMDKETRKKRGFGFITFDDYDAVDKLVLLKHHHIGSFRVEVKKAVSKQDMEGAASRGGGRGGGRGGRGGGGRGGGRGGGQGGGFGGGNSYGGGQGGGYGGGNQGGYGGGNNYNQGGGGGGSSWGGNQGGGQSWGGNQQAAGQWGANQNGGGQQWGGQQGGYQQGGQQQWGAQQNAGYGAGQQAAAGGWGGQQQGGGSSFGTDYNSGNFSGPQRGGNNYNQRSSGPYGGGYGSGGNAQGGGYGGGNNYGNRR